MTARAKGIWIIRENKKQCLRRANDPKKKRSFWRKSEKERKRVSEWREKKNRIQISWCNHTKATLACRLFSRSNTKPRSHGVRMTSIDFGGECVFVRGLMWYVPILTEYINFSLSLPRLLFGCVRSWIELHFRFTLKGGMTFRSTQPS